PDELKAELDLARAQLDEFARQRDTATAWAMQLREALERAKSDLFDVGANCDCDDGCANCERVEEASERIASALATPPDVERWLRAEHLKGAVNSGGVS